jgi:hypothetical protein
MLQPDRRLTLIEALRPPAGYVVDRAIGTTFSLDLQALLTAPAAFALVEARESDGEDVAPIELLDSIRRHADRITLFCQAGQIALPVQTRMLPFLEHSVVPVRAPNGGVFHPKVWVLRFHSQDGETVRYRVLCASRNLTFDRSWDTVLRLDQADADDEGAALPALSSFVAALPGMAVLPLVDSHAEALTGVAAELATVRFMCPPGVDHMTFHALGLTGEKTFSFPTRVRRLLIISPFLDGTFLQRAPRASDGSMLVSRPDALDEAGRAALARFSETMVLVPEAQPADEDEATPELSAPPDDPRWPVTGLHAKLFVLEDDGVARMFTGSANATSAAFARNVEALVELRAPVEVLGVDALLGAPDGEVGLHALLAPYLPSEDAAAAEEPARLDLLRRAIAELAFTGRVTPSDQGEAYLIEYTATGAAGLPDDVAMRWWPATLPPEAGRAPTYADAQLSAQFTVSFDHLTAFLAVELTEARQTTRFVVPVALEGVPEDRVSRLLRQLIGSAPRLLAYLLMLLADESTNRYDLVEALERAARGDASARIPPGLPLLETMLAALRRDPARLESVQSLVEELRASEEGKALLPEGFEAVWEAIWAVARERAA